MDENLIKNELQKYNMTDAAIAKLKTDYMALVVKNPTDTSGYEIAKRARIEIKQFRVSVEKTRVTLKAESLEYGRRVDGEAKRITALLEPIETHLIGQEKIVEDEKARIKAEAEEREVARIQARVDKLESLGMGLIAGNYKLPYGCDGVAVPVALLRVCTDEQFAEFLVQIQAKKEAEDARVKAEDAAQKAEQERLAKVAAEQDAERKSLEAIARENEEKERKRLYDIAEESRKALVKERLETSEREKKEAAIRAEAERVRKEKEEWEAIKAQEARDIAAAKQKVIDDAKHAAELEKAKASAIEQARIDVEAKIKRQVEESAAADLNAKIAAEKKAARAPDRVKLLLYADQIEAVVSPELKTEEGRNILLVFDNELGSILKALLRDAVEAL